MSYDENFYGNDMEDDEEENRGPSSYGMNLGNILSAIGGKDNSHYKESILKDEYYIELTSVSESPIDSDDDLIYYFEVKRNPNAKTNTIDYFSAHEMLTTTYYLEFMMSFVFHKFVNSSNISVAIRYYKDSPYILIKIETGVNNKPFTPANLLTILSDCNWDILPVYTLTDETDNDGIIFSQIVKKHLTLPAVNIEANWYFPKYSGYKFTPEALNVLYLQYMDKLIRMCMPIFYGNAAQYSPLIKELDQYKVFNVMPILKMDDGSMKLSLFITPSKVIGTAPDGYYVYEYKYLSPSLALISPENVGIINNPDDPATKDGVPYYSILDLISNFQSTPNVQTVCVRSSVVGKISYKNKDYDLYYFQSINYAYSEMKITGSNAAFVLGENWDAKERLSMQMNQVKYSPIVQVKTIHSTDILRVWYLDTTMNIIEPEKDFSNLNALVNAVMNLELPNVVKMSDLTVGETIYRCFPNEELPIQFYGMVEFKNGDSAPLGELILANDKDICPIFPKEMNIKTRHDLAILLNSKDLYLRCIYTDNGLNRILIGKFEPEHK